MAIRCPIGGYLTSSLFMPRVTSSDVVTAGVWIRVRATQSSSTSYYYGLEEPGTNSTKLSFGYRKSEGDYYWYAHDTGAGSYGRYMGSHTLPDQWRFMVWKYMLGRSKSAVYYRLYKENSDTYDGLWLSLSGGFSEFIAASTNKLMFGAARNSSAKQCDVEIANAFWVDKELTSAEMVSLATGDTIDSLVYTPRSWWKLSDKDDLTDYGTAGNDLTKHGSGFTTVPGPSVLTDTQPPHTETPGILTYDGQSYVKRPVMVWMGAAYKKCPLKRYDQPTDAWVDAS